MCCLFSYVLFFYWMALCIKSHNNYAIVVLTLYKWWSLPASGARLVDWVQQGGFSRNGGGADFFFVLHGNA